MIKNTIICVAAITILGCGSSHNYRQINATPVVQSTTITVNKPTGGVYISPTTYKDYTCDDLNEEFIGVSRASSQASLRNLDDSINNLSRRLNESALDRQTRELRSHELNSAQANNEANYDARLYAIAKAASKINGCQMSMNNKDIILSE